LVLQEHVGTVETGQRKSVSTGGAGLVARVEGMSVPLTWRAHGCLLRGGARGLVIVAAAAAAPLLLLLVVAVLVVKDQEKMCLLHPIVLVLLITMLLLLLFWILALVSRVSTYVFPSPSLFLIYLFSDLWILATIRTSVLESCFPKVKYLFICSSFNLFVWL